MKKKWSDIKVGDTFIDGSVVTNIEDWTKDECYKIISTNGDEMIVSSKHLFKVDIIHKESKERLNKYMYLSRQIREDMGMEPEDPWICAHDLNLVKNIAEIKLNENLYIKEINSVGVKPVRCITTNTGQYEIFGFINHNTGGSDLTPEQRAKENEIEYTIKGFQNSQVVMDATEAETTEHARKIMSDGLKRIMKENNLKVDEYNMEVLAKAMTSYKRDRENGGKWRLCKDGEKCDIIGVKALGDYGNPLKQAMIQTPYKTITKEELSITIPKDSAMDTMFMDI